LPQKWRFGPWVYVLFRVLARVRRVRGTAFDIFGYTAERRHERALAKEFTALMKDEVLPSLSSNNHAQALALADDSCLRSEAKVDFHSYAEADALRIQQRHITADDARLFESPDPS
jgi:hypothetical protein